MATIQLGYGDSSIPFQYDPARFEVLLPTKTTWQPLSDREINQALDTPIDSPPLEELIEAGDTVLIVVSDATRATGSAQIVNLLVRRLIESGILPGHIAIIFATGIHRPVRPDEKVHLLTSFIAQRIQTIDHDAYDPQRMVQVGELADGSPIEVNRALKDFAKVIVTGGVGFHYFAGFTGGRKSICPGLASARTIEATHMLALDSDRGGRRAGVGTGLLDGNAVSEACEQAAALIEPVFTINAIVDDQGRVEKIYAGHWRASHRRACEDYLASHSRTITAKRDVVVVSCGGAPYDINIIQAHKALDMAAHACAAGGTILLIAECGDGLGRDDFLKWFDAADSRALENRVRQEYEVNGQTAWALLTKTEQFQVRIVTRLNDELSRRMRLLPTSSIEDALANISPEKKGYVLPRGAALLPIVS
jgi:lactate racemase